jgi:hypothetical protein
MESAADEVYGRENLVRGVAVGAVILFWCVIGALVYAIKRKARADPAATVETAVVTAPTFVFAPIPRATLVA